MTITKGAFRGLPRSNDNVCAPSNDNGPGPSAPAGAMARSGSFLGRAS